MHRRLTAERHGTGKAVHSRLIKVEERAVPSAWDKKLWADAANQIRASIERCRAVDKSELYSAEIIARSHDAIARSYLRIADVGQRRGYCFAGFYAN